MGKYIIELERGETAYKTVNSNGKPMIQLLAPTPYTEPDLEKVRKEAYEKGFDAGRMLNNGKYEKGLNDAWEAARKICTNWVLPDSVLSEIFGMDKTIDDIMKETTASEAIEKIRQYEQGKEEIKVGDEIENKMTKSKGVVVMDDEDSVRCLSPHGTIFCVGKSRCIRIGHFPEIAEVLAKMKETDNG